MKVWRKGDLMEILYEGKTIEKCLEDSIKKGGSKEILCSNEERKRKCCY